MKLVRPLFLRRWLLLIHKIKDTKCDLYGHQVGINTHLVARFCYAKLGREKGLCNVYFGIRFNVVNVPLESAHVFLSSCSYTILLNSSNETV